jgi:hypothetical protein
MLFTNFEHFKSATHALYKAIRSNPSMKISEFRETLISNSSHIDVNTYKASLNEEPITMTSLELATLITTSAVLVTNSNCWLNASSIEGDLLNLYHSDDTEDYYDNFGISNMKFKYYGDGKFGLFDEENFEFMINIFEPLKIPEIIQAKQVIIAVEYFSYWGHGRVESTAEINIETLEISNIKEVEVDDSYAHLESEEISIIYSGEYYDFEVKDSQLTDDGKIKIKAFIEKYLS